MFYSCTLMSIPVFIRGVPDGPLAANGDLGVVLGGEPGTALGPPGGKSGGIPGALGVSRRAKQSDTSIFASSTDTDSAYNTTIA